MLPYFPPHRARLLAAAFLIFAAYGASKSAWAEITETVTNAGPPRHPWLSAQVTQTGAAAYFTNLQSGDTVQSPFVAKFGLSQWNLAPAKFNIIRTGHHHLLIDAPLPIPPDTPIPFSDNYVHFGAGQIEHVLNLPPGRHTLRLLLANHAHVPYYVYSPELVVNVAEGRSDLSERYGKGRKVEFLNLPTDRVLTAPFKLQFHASGLSIASARTRTPTSGHFVLKFKRPGKDETIEFNNGATEDWFAPPAGTYALELSLVKNGNAAEVLAHTETTIQVVERNTP
ncbi:MAG: DUF4399 domain-containing protein [Comamonas sp.]